MTTEVDDEVSPAGAFSPEEEAFWEKFLAAWRAEGSPPPERICLLAWDEHEVRISPSAVTGWIAGLRVPRIWESDRPQPFKIVLKVLRVDEAIGDWERLARAAHKAKTARLAEARAAQKGAVPASGEPKSDGHSEPGGTSEPSLGPAESSGSNEAGDDAPFLAGDEAEPIDLSAITGERPDVVPTAPEFSSPPSGSESPLSRPPTGLASLPDRRGRKLPIVVGTSVLVMAGVFAVSYVTTRPKDSPPTAETVSSFEARVNGVQVGVANRLAKTIFVFSKPGTPNDGCGYSPCVADSEQVGSVQHGQVVKVVCVATGQRIRNGVGTKADGYHDDNRWVQLGPGQGIEGIGYLSNTYFARDTLPQNLPTCTR